MTVETKRHDRLATFFDILASGDRSRYRYARSMMTSDAHSVNEPSQEETAEEILQLSNSKYSGLRDRGDSVLKDTAKSSGLIDSAEIPTVDAKNKFTFRILLHELHGMDAFKKLVKTVLRESQANFRPLAEVSTGQPDAACHKAARLGVNADMQEGSLRLKRAAKRRCVGHQERPGADAETTQWVYETLHASKRRYDSATIPGIYKTPPVSLQQLFEHENAAGGTLNGMPSQFSMLEGMNGARGLLQNDVLRSGRKRRVMEQY